MHALALEIALPPQHAGAGRAPTPVVAPRRPDPRPLAPYGAPVIALVHPPAGGSVPRARPVVVFRFAPGEPDDPIDAASFAVHVDGVDRSSLFHVAGGEAWGALAAGGELASGEHRVQARVCSLRGVCAGVATAVAVLPWGEPPAPAPAPPRWRRLLDLLLVAARKLLAP